jgi:ABC-type transporter lipoprotein component MlaA
MRHPDGIDRVIANQRAYRESSIMTNTQLIGKLTFAADLLNRQGNGDMADAVTLATTALTEADAKLKTVLDREAETIRRYDARLDEAEAKLAKARGKFIAIRDAYLDNEGGKVMMKIAVNALAELREG